MWFSQQLIKSKTLFLSHYSMISTDSKTRFEQLKTNYWPKHLHGSESFRTVETALEAVLRCQTDQKRKEHAQKVIIKYFQANDPAVCTELLPESFAILKEMREWLKFFKHGFIQSTNEIKAYQKFENSNITDCLISIQGQLDYHNILQSYTNALLSIKEQFSWTQQFVFYWVQQSKYMKENKIELFKKIEQPNETKLNYNKGGKRCSPSSNCNADAETQAGEEPVKKVKADSVNYRALILIMERILEISTGAQKVNLKRMLEEFIKTESIQYLQLLEQETAKRIFEMRSFIKLFLNAFTEATVRPEYRKFADKDFLEKIFSFQNQVDPDNVFESYKIYLESNSKRLNWPDQFVHLILRRVVQQKKIQNETLLKRQ